jgi:hypothetical protein
LPKASGNRIGTFRTEPIVVLIAGKPGPNAVAGVSISVYTSTYPLIKMEIPHTAHG